MSPQMRSMLSCLVLTMVLSNPATAAVPLIINTTTVPLLSIYNNVSYTPQYKCTKVKFFKSDHRPTWPECYRAIRALPSGSESGTFHNYGVNNRYRLPAMEKFGRCRAQVELAEDRGVAVSNWVAVTAKLDELSILCRRRVRDEERTAGWSLMGPEDRIKVSLLGPDDGPFVIEGFISNGTELE